MAHIQIDYSANLGDRLDLPGLCQALLKAAAETGVFPVAGLRVRAASVQHYAIADGDPGHGFLDINVRMGAGRSFAEKEQATQAIFEAAETLCAGLLEDTPFLLSLETREIDPDLSRKTSSIRDYLPEELH